MGVMPFPKGDWAGLAERTVVAIERISRSYDFDSSETDPFVAQLEIIRSIHAEYHDRLETYLANTDAFKKMKAMRALSAEAKKRSDGAAERIEYLHGKTGEAG